MNYLNFYCCDISRILLGYWYFSLIVINLEYKHSFHYYSYGTRWYFHVFDDIFQNMSLGFFSDIFRILKEMRNCYFQEIFCVTIVGKCRNYCNFQLFIAATSWWCYQDIEFISSTNITYKVYCKYDFVCELFIAVTS